MRNRLNDVGKGGGLEMIEMWVGGRLDLAEPALGSDPPLPFIFQVSPGIHAEHPAASHPHQVDW